MNFLQTSGLKPSQFVRDNRRGFTCHTLVNSASGLPLGIEPELITDDSGIDTTIRLCRNQLAPAHKGNQPNLSNVVLFADRFYWNSKMFKFVSDTGLQIGPSTHKRSVDFPFTFDQKVMILECAYQGKVGNV